MVESDQPVGGLGAFQRFLGAGHRRHGQGAGCGEDGFRANVRSAIKRIRNKFRACDPTFDKIENYTSFGYCWKKPD